MAGSDLRLMSVLSWDKPKSQMCISPESLIKMLLALSTWRQHPRLVRVAHLEIAVQDVSREEIVHPKGDLVDHCELVASFALGGLKVIDYVAIAHYLVSR